MSCKDTLREARTYLREAFAAKAEEFSTYAVMLEEEDEARLTEVRNDRR